MANSPEAAADVSALSFEQALSELEALVKRLEQGEGSLDDAIADYERGTALKKHCEAKLKEAKAKIDKIVMEDGGPSAAPMDQD